MSAWIAVGVAGFGLGAEASAGDTQSSRRADDIDAGRELYRRHCVQCHGEYGAGDGAATASLVAPVSDLTGVIPDGEVRDADVELLLYGRGPMPGFEQSFDDYEARRILRYVQHLPQQREEDERTRPLWGDWALSTADLAPFENAVTASAPDKFAGPFTKALKPQLTVEIGEGELLFRGIRRYEFTWTVRRPLVEGEPVRLQLRHNDLGALTFGFDVVDGELNMHFGEHVLVFVPKADEPVVPTRRPAIDRDVPSKRPVPLPLPVPGR